MISWVHDAGPSSYCLLLGAALVLAASRARWRRWAAIAGLVLVGLGLEASRFDGQPHVTEKVDATTFFWARAITLRAVTGLVALVVAAPIGLAAAPSVGTSRATAWGLGVIGSVGAGALASGITLMLALRSATEHAASASDAVAARAIFSAQIRAGMDQSEIVIAAGMALSTAFAVTTSLRLIRGTVRHQDAGDDFRSNTRA